MSVDALRHARRSKVTFVLTSDAHHVSELGRVDYAALNAARAWIEPAQVANAESADRVLAWATKVTP
jgi:histidinol phosphatase-like PHP family hydrolase